MRVLERGLDKIDLPAVYVEVVPAGREQDGAPADDE
jgi:hypothetical protein